VAFGGGEFKEDEKRLISKLGARSKQIIHKSGSDQELWQLYRNASAFIYPSKYEGFGLPPLEAMSLNCPVISSNTSSMPEVIVDAAEFFDPNDQNDLFRAISNVMSSKSRQEELRALGKKRVEKLSWGTCAKKTLDIYKTLQR
jgi:glycosyltransferase involved in cell wall biosynthesis